jgi:outer membrane protein OmpA-like peptidoglycan-associated protein
VVAIFDLETITLSGAVPSQAAVERLAALALANSKTPATVTNLLTINPAVPINVGVRVIELNSVRFPAGSAEVLPPHALELDRVARVMAALPNVSVLVIGHADQRGSDAENFAISDARARAVVNYLISVGVESSRLSSRAVGESDLLLIDDDEAALALNRRTEFIFYGLLLD